MFLFFFSCIAPAGEHYQWVDKDGIQNFSNCQKPPGGIHQFNNLGQKKDYQGQQQIIPVTSRKHFKTSPLKSFTPSVSPGTNRYELSQDAKDGMKAANARRENKYRQKQELKEKEFELEKEKFEYMKQRGLPVTFNNKNDSNEQGKKPEQLFIENDINDPVNQPRILNKNNNNTAFDQHGTFYMPAAGGSLINTQTGAFLTPAAGGYINTQTGQFVPSN